jgi:D-inositol-3-phosphate glycosyltransferase
MRRLLIVSLNGDPLAELGAEHAGGQCRYVLEISKRLAAYEWSSVVFTVRNGNAPQHERVGMTFDLWRVSLDGVDAYEPAACLRQIETIAVRIIDIIETRRVAVDVILACYWLSGLAALRLAKRLGRKMVMSFCSLGAYKAATSGTEAMSDRIALERYIAAEANHILATSSEEADTLTATYGADMRKISIIPRGIDLDVFRPLL